MTPAEWERVPGPWRLARALRSGVFAGLAAAVLALMVL